MKETGDTVRLWWLRQFQQKSLLPPKFKYDTKPTFRKRGHWFWAWGHDDQNHWGRFSALAVDTKYPRARGCCFSSSGASLERRRSPWLWKTKSREHDQRVTDTSNKALKITFLSSPSAQHSPPSDSFSHKNARWPRKVNKERHGPCCMDRHWMKTTAQAEGTSKTNYISQANTRLFALVSFLLNVGCVPWHPASNYTREEWTPAAEGAPKPRCSFTSNQLKYTSAPDRLLSTTRTLGKQDTSRLFGWRQCLWPPSRGRSACEEALFSLSAISLNTRLLQEPDCAFLQLAFSSSLILLAGFKGWKQLCNYYYASNNK